MRTETTVRTAVWACLTVLGDDLRVVMEPVLEAEFGSDWPQALLRRRRSRGCSGSGAGRSDPYALLRELAEPTSPARSVLPRDKQWLDDSQRVLGIRNDVTHEGTEVVEVALEQVALMESLARRANLPCHAEFAVVRQRLAALDAGEVFDADAEVLAGAQARVDAAEVEAADAATRQRRLAEEVAQKDAYIAQLEAQLEAQLADQQAARRAEAELRRAREEAAAATQREQAARKQAEATARELERQRQSAEQAARQVERPEEVVLPLGELLARLRERSDLPEAGPDQGVGGAGDAGGGDLPTPGQPWPYVVGHERWRLSKVYRSLTRVADDVDLDDVVGEDAATRLVDAFLAVRPDGGKVLVDSDGDAVTWLRGQWVYLGRLASEPAVPAGPRPGDVLGIRPAGRKYTMRADGSIRRAAGGQELADVVGVLRAAHVRARICAVKPTGGSLWVDRDGTVAAYRGNSVVFVTALAPEEWFPGVLGAVG